MAVDFLKIKAFAFDVDGVMTNGGILCTKDGDLYRTFDAKDGFAVRMAVMNGYPVGVITGGRSVSIRKRFTGCGIPEGDIFLGSTDKIEDLRKFCDAHGLTPDEVMFFGDDIPDLEVILNCGIGACPSDAVPEVKAAADWISSRPGGRGVIREGFEAVMKARGDWDFDVSTYKKLF